LACPKSQTENIPEAFPEGYVDVDEEVKPFMSNTGEEPNEGWCRWFLVDHLKVKERKEGWRQTCRATLRELIHRAFGEDRASSEHPVEAAAER
jgi:hypothetical protein